MPKITEKEVQLLLKIFRTRESELAISKNVSPEEYHQISLIPKFQQLFNDIAPSIAGYYLELRPECFKFLIAEIMKQGHE